MAGAFDIRFSDTAKSFDIDVSLMSRSATRLRSAPMMLLLNTMNVQNSVIDNFDRMNVAWLYPLNISDQTPGAGGGVFQPVMVRQQGVPYMPGANDRPRSWNPF